MQKQLKPPFLIDLPLLISAFSLVCFSLVMIYSTTAVVSTERFGDPYFYVKRQGIAVVIGLIGLYLCTRLSIETIRRSAPWCLFMALGLVVLTFIPGLGRSSGGAQRWINLPFLSFQPAELAKILFVIFLAGFFERRKDRLDSFWLAVALPLFFVVSIAALLLKQPDFGSSAIITVVALSMILSVGVRMRYLLIASLPLLLAVAGLVITSPYRLKRIITFLSPGEDVLGKGYQLTQSLIAVSRGGFTGEGLGDSMQKLHFLPAAHTDFIFAVVAEELGFVGAVILVAVFLVVLWRGFRIANQMVPDLFTYTFAVGLTMLLVAPALVNVGVVTGMLPTKGLVLPLVGYGGSSMICSLIAIGLLLTLARHQYRNAV